VRAVERVDVHGELGARERGTDALVIGEMENSADIEEDSFRSRHRAKVAATASVGRCRQTNPGTAVELFSTFHDEARRFRVTSQEVERGAAPVVCSYLVELRPQLRAIAVPDGGGDFRRGSARGIDPDIGVDAGRREEGRGNDQHSQQIERRPPRVVRLPDDVTGTTAERHAITVRP
jgi:hypothetical protein